jgi:hypothetical protein
MVDNIAHFRAELEFSPFLQTETLEDREVDVYELILLYVSFFVGPSLRWTIRLLRPRSVSVLKLDRNTDTAGSLQ